jgi:hypothetical protein
VPAIETADCNSGFGAGMAEASVFISLSAAADKSIQSIALSGLFEAVNVGIIGGLSASGAILEASLTRELEYRVPDVGNREEVSCPASTCGIESLFSPDHQKIGV